MSCENSRQDDIQGAIRNGLEIVVAGERDIFLDVDTDEDFAHFEKVRPLLAKWMQIQTVYMWRSKSNHRHIHIVSKVDIPIERRVLIQACCGSDRMKELCTLFDLMQSPNNVPLLFRPKGAAITSI